MYFFELLEILIVKKCTDLGQENRYSTSGKANWIQINEHSAQDFDYEQESRTCSEFMPVIK